MDNKLDIVLESLRNICDQIPGLNRDEIHPDLILNGENSLFDSFSILLFLVEIENSVGHEMTKPESLIEWYSNLNMEEENVLSLREFSQLLSDNFFNG